MILKMIDLNNNTGSDKKKELFGITIIVKVNYIQRTAECMTLVISVTTTAGKLLFFASFI